MSRLNPKKDYIVKILEETLYSETNQFEIISLIELAIRAFNDSYEEVDAELSWRTRVDEGLAKHLLIMFEQTKNTPVNKIDIEKFKSIWNQYSETEEYYMQILNYIVNSNDYIYGDRFNFGEDSKDNSIRFSNYLSNAMYRWEGFKENPRSKSIYYSKLMTMGRELKRVMIEKQL